MSIFIAIIILSFLIVIHELGHFIAAKVNGVKVLEFSLFMGPKLFSFRKGETDYSIRLIPMGGYVKMEGEEAESDDARAFNKKSVGSRAAIIAAGPLTNILVAVLILTVVFSVIGYATTEISETSPKFTPENLPLKPGDQVVKVDGKRVYSPSDIEILVAVSNGEPIDITYKSQGEGTRTVTVTPVVQPQAKYQLGFASSDYPEGGVKIVSLQEGLPAHNAGLMAGDIIIAINGETMNSVMEIRTYLTNNQTAPVDIEILRGDDKMTVYGVVPVLNKDVIRDLYTLGLGYNFENGNVFQSFSHACGYSVTIMRGVLYSIGWMIEGRVSNREVSGPVGIVSTISSSVSQGQNVMQKFQSIIEWIVLLSLNLGIMNLIPFPALDGSKLLILLVEKVRRKPLKPEREAMITIIGLFILTGLLLLVTFNDILKFFR